MRRWLAPIVVATLLGTVATFNGELLADTLARLRQLSWGGSLTVAGCTAAVVLSRALAVWAATPGLTVGRCAVADQTAHGAANGLLFGGGAVGTAAKVAMFRSWGLGGTTIAASVVAAAVFPSFVTWGLASTMHAPAVLAGQATWPETVATISGAVLVIGAAILWFVALRWSAPSVFVGRIAGRLLLVADRRVPVRLVRLRARLAAVEPQRATGELRIELQQLLLRRGPLMFSMSLLATAATFVALWVSLHLLGVEGIGVIAALSAFSLVRVLTAVTPVPGGMGVAEVGLVSLLSQSSIDRPGVLGAIVLFRAMTWLAPMAFGTVGFTWWRRSRRPASAAEWVEVGSPADQTWISAEVSPQVAGTLLG